MAARIWLKATMSAKTPIKDKPLCPAVAESSLSWLAWRAPPSELYERSRSRLRYHSTPGPPHGSGMEYVLDVIRDQRGLGSADNACSGPATEVTRARSPARSISNRTKEKPWVPA